MSGASTFPPTHGTAPLKPCREHVTVRICVGIRGRAHRHLIGFNRPSTNNLARTERAATPLPGSSVMMPLGSSQARRGASILNSFGALSARSSSFLVAFVNDCRQPTNRFFRSFQFSPALSLLAAAHVVSSSNGAKVCPTKEFPKPENEFPRIA